ncbi:Peptidoglycan/LPS O-acetylase OafA/YrhL, contains acyltransferase and SGNH-hydrolase domains [Prauserella aidingensis]|uniref:acyltransferase family protein n=1 Tax=Prauserella aidingensis TaxID=387890 RepID=UPI0020A4B119|nr:acyltransferase family protein [Prauserella aidingensis]MCP2252339.1 Peptidoglycan/LPS O-acetylase OafA/YrhL, contains acyltransferase and SGNH-hydrolase domains [Prauserella aidingensis]
MTTADTRPTTEPRTRPGLTGWWSAAPGAERTFRPELQGLRAIAALLVVAYHVWLDRISGGVDVFFVVSGFLITGQLVRARSRGRIAFRPFWGRMIKRLFPAALLVLAATMVAAYLWLPEHRWFATIREVVAAALYLENWQLVATSADYFAARDEASPTQHYWSLSIQGQFYVAWPLLIAFLGLLAARSGWSLRRTVFGSLLTIGAGSLAYSVWLTAADQPLAYFTSLTRIWEFALGGLLALVIDRIALPRALRLVLGWLGVAGLVSCGLILQVGSVFPGYAALWPTMSAVFVLVAGATASPLGADRFLSSRPVSYLGDISYALYLWHWPVLMFYLIVRDRTEVGPRGGAVIIAASLVLAVITYHLVENPVRRSNIGVTKPWRAYSLGAAMLVVVLGLATVWQVHTLDRASFTQHADDPDHPGALVVRHDAPLYDPRHDVVPPAAALDDEYYLLEPDGDFDCSTSPRSDEVEICVKEPTGTPTRTIVTVGDSHVLQYGAAFEPLVDRNDWRVVTLYKRGCAFSAGDYHLNGMPIPPDCARWNDAVLPEILELDPDAVFSMATRDAYPGLTESTPENYVVQWRRVADAGIPLVLARDNPRFRDWEPSACVLKHGYDADRCTRPRAEIYAPEPPYAALADLPPEIHFLDLTDRLCPGDTCEPVIGNVLVYRDDDHLTQTYQTTMATVLEERMVDALGW